MSKPRLYADFHNADAQGRLRLNCVGTEEDLTIQRIELSEGLAVTLYSDDLNEKGNPDELIVEGLVSYSVDEHCWVASIDWNAIRHVSDAEQSASNGSALESPASPTRPASRS